MKTPSPAVVLVVEDEPAMARGLQMLLQARGYRCDHADSGKMALERIAAARPDLVLLDLGLPDIEGLELLRRIRVLDDKLPVLIVTAQDSVATAIECIRAGAFHFVSKPYAGPELVSLVEKALDGSRLLDETEALKQRQHVLERELEATRALLRPVFKSPAMHAIEALLERVAPSDASVLLLGESGSGKEVVAARLHEMSARVAGPFVRINCGAISPNMLEAELFGYVKGAFTGANSAYEGVFQQAHGGTLFLDEIAELPAESQTRLLRVLQEREFRPIGSSRVVQVDFRLVSATNRVLDKALEEGRFREDLFYRVNTFQITVPPLRDRSEDIPGLVSHFLQRFGGRGGKRPPAIDAEALSLLSAHLWPGNVRELQNAIEHAVVIASGRITVADLPASIREAVELRQSSGSQATGMLRQAERMALRAALDKAQGNKSTAARVLGIGRATLYAKLREAGLLREGKRGRPRKIHESTQ